MKRCKTCGISKKTTAFTRQKQRSGNYAFNFECKECACGRQAKRYQNRTEEQKLKKKDTFIRRLYGIGLEEYQVLFDSQEGKCAACQISQEELPKALVIDHCHASNKVRGLLCSGCNLALGNVKENIAALLGLAAYIKGPQS